MTVSNVTVAGNGHYYIQWQATNVRTGNVVTHQEDKDADDDRDVNATTFFG